MDFGCPAVGLHESGFAKVREVSAVCASRKIVVGQLETWYVRRKIENRICGTPGRGRCAALLGATIFPPLTGDFSFGSLRSHRMIAGSESGRFMVPVHSRKRTEASRNLAAVPEKAAANYRTPNAGAATRERRAMGSCPNASGGFPGICAMSPLSPTSRRARLFQRCHLLVRAVV